MKIFLFLILIGSLVLIPTYSSYELSIPPTKAYSHIITSNGTVTATNYNGGIKLNGSGITITANPLLQTIFFSLTGSALSFTNQTCSQGQFFNQDTKYSNGTVTFSCISGSSSNSSATYDTISNIGGQTGSIYAGNTSKTDFQFKTIKAGPNISISNYSSYIMINATSGGTDIDPAPKVSINGNNRTTFTGILANQTFAAPKVSINGLNASSFTIYNNTMSNNGHGGKGLYISKTNNNYNLRNITSSNTSHITIDQNNTDVLFDIGFKINSKACGVNSFITTVSNNTDSTCASPVDVSSLDSLTGPITMQGVSGNTTITNGASTITINTGWNIPLLNGIETFLNTVTFNSLKLGGQMDLNGNTMKSSGHVYTFPSNTGNILLGNGSASSLTNNVRGITAGSGISINGSTGTVQITSTASGGPTTLGSNLTSSSTTAFTHIWNIPLTANSGNAIEGVLVATTNTAGGAVQVGANMSSVATGSGLCTFTYGSAGTTLTPFSAALTTTSSDSAWTTILAGANQAYPIMFDCAIAAGATPPTLQINFQAEVSSTVSIKAGSFYIKTP